MSDIISVAIGGDSGVGKTMLMNRMANRPIDIYSYISTIGVDFMSRTFHDIGRTVNFWDLAGHVKFDTIVKSYFKGTNMLILMYRCDSMKSVRRAKLLHNMYKNSDTSGNIIIVGNLNGNIFEDLYIKNNINNFCVKNYIKRIVVDTKTNIGIEKILKVVLEIDKKTTTSFPIQIPLIINKEKSNCMIL